MRRSWIIWVIFCVGSMAALAGMAWISRSVLDLDARVRHDNQLEENVRLALWRMDALVNPLIVQESGRSFEESDMVDLASKKNDSEALSIDDARILARFQINCTGIWRIAEAGNIKAIVELKATSPTMASLGLCDESDLAMDLNANNDVQTVQIQGQMANRNSAGNNFGQSANPLNIDVNNGELNNQRGFNGSQNPEQTNTLAQNLQSNPTDVNFNNRINGQNTKSMNEYQARAQSQYISNMANTSYRNNNNDKVSQIREGPMAAMWEGPRLILARRVWVNQKNAAQGAVLNWEAIKTQLLTSIGDLLPRADLVPIVNEQDPLTLQRRLATIPAMLVPGDIALQRDVEFTPLRMVLLVAWIFMALGTLAVCGLLWGTLRLSRRREDFVSAVTHELRTPITSVTMYAEMLQAGMAADENKRTQYLGTLQTEAHRLGRLIENVLSFSRIERGKIARRIEEMDIKTTLEQIKPRLEARANQAELTIEWAIPDGINALADSSALEQILFNLVDNAAKYAGGAKEKRILIEGKCVKGNVELWVRDFGPGIEPGTKLFKPFSKSAKDAANSAPGVGLGLALSRRLARGMKGELRHEAEVKPGACFVVELRM